MKKYGTQSTQAQRDAAVAFTRAAMAPNYSGFAPYDPETDIDVRSVPSDAAAALPRRIPIPPLTLCDKVGIASGRIFLCRYRAGHGGKHYFAVHGAEEVKD